jgi:hypothetical protein
MAVRKEKIAERAPLSRALRDGTTSVLASVIGARVRQERQAQRLTLDQ